jgi:hypothetical protein
MAVGEMIDRELSQTLVVKRNVENCDTLQH